MKVNFRCRPTTKAARCFDLLYQSNRRWALRQRRFKHGCARLSAPADEVIEWASLCRLLAQRYRRRRPDFMVGIGGTADIDTRVASANQVESDPNRTRGVIGRNRRRSVASGLGVRSTNSMRGRGNCEGHCCEMPRAPWRFHRWQTPCLPRSRIPTTTERPA